MTKAVYTAANWSQHDDSFTQLFYTQNTRQFWLPEEISLTGDIHSWKSLTDEERRAYMQVLAGLTMLDTIQGDDGMTSIVQHVEGHQRKAVLTFMAAMENAVHAKSYSNIFMTLASKEEIDGLFRWVQVNPYLQRKAGMIRNYYDNITDQESLYKAMVMSVFLESFLFYSGFYYPLYFYGQGRMMNSGEIINLIIRDESIHGVYVGLLAQELYGKFSAEKQEELKDFVFRSLQELYENEVEYTSDVYDPVGLSSDVKVFVRYNANKALANLGFDSYFEDEEVNPVVLNGLSTETKSHDFFSQKGNGYKKANIEPIKDEDFIFE
ncbi:class 1b ribonucleoside-diphosphate reductase subunit beta [Ammoniphilus oxalaticus]|uniref:Ribonucleoside-diphosphate reductase subunit beta n=1 Tax=Ammoniphilus oxalaticus TaxID=66863 RepID=A0A419SNJ6_9BACL|nr:class 1b ribonucleoside-diphosphate reductase subunit beta [Ammoniphilus oxalaticus]RKD25837.1 class 1b ribonucleoside-diphosphate reductase subunit beta [Ammoniphilus oxalaticus]